MHTPGCLCRLSDSYSGCSSRLLGVGKLCPSNCLVVVVTEGYNGDAFQPESLIHSLLCAILGGFFGFLFWVDEYFVVPSAGSEQEQAVKYCHSL